MREVWICKNDFCAAANRIYDSLEMLHRECAVAADENARGLTHRPCLIEHLFGQFAYFITCKPQHGSASETLERNADRILSGKKNTLLRDIGSSIGKPLGNRFGGQG